MKNIIINEKADDGNISYYPENNAYNVERTTRDISYINGNTLLEVLQDMSNKYIAPHGDFWEDTGLKGLNDESVICSVLNFVCILTPFNEGDLHEINILISFDGGKSWDMGSYSNSNTEYRINKILGAEAHYSGTYEVVLIGVAGSDSAGASTYKMQFSPGRSVPYKVNKFTNQISLFGTNTLFNREEVGDDE